MFRKKPKEPVQTGGCDPEVFAAEIRTFIARSSEVKVEGAAAFRRATVELKISPPPRPRAATGARRRRRARAPNLRPRRQATTRPGRPHSSGNPATTAPQRRRPKPHRSRRSSLRETAHAAPPTRAPIARSARPSGCDARRSTRRWPPHRHTPKTCSARRRSAPTIFAARQTSTGSKRSVCGARQKPPPSAPC